MKLAKALLVMAAALAFCSPAVARQRVAISCSQGGVTLSVPGGPSLTPQVQASYPGCVVSIFLTGTLKLVPIYSDNNGTALSNPFTISGSAGFFYVDPTHFDTRLSGGGISTPFTIGDGLALDLGYDVTVNTLTPFSVNVSLGAAMCNGTEVHYAGGTINSLVASVDNYIYLDTSAGCAPAFNTTGFTAATLPIAEVFTDSSGIINIITRAGMVGNGGGGGGGGACPGTVAQWSLLFVNPAGVCDGVTKFTSNEAGQVDINSGGTFEIDAPTTPLSDFTFAQGTQVYITSDSADYDGSTADGFTAYVNDVNTPPQASGALTGTNVTVASGVLTVAATGASTLFPNPGMYANISGCSTATFLNGQIVQVTNADAGQLIAATTSFSDYPSAGDNCTVQLQTSSNPRPFYSAMGCSMGGVCVGFESDSQHFSENPQASTVIDFLATAYGDGPDYGYGVDVQEHLYVKTESAQLIAESSGAFTNEHQYAIKVGNPNATPFFWVDEGGAAFSRQGLTNVASVTVGSCAIDTGLNDCTAGVYANGLGPPASETITLSVCVRGTDYDTFDWTLDGSYPTCSSPHMFAAVAGSPVTIADDIYVQFASATGHTLGATVTIPVTVNFGSQIGNLGGTYFASTAIPTPGTPHLSSSTSGAGTWEYCVAETWNGVTTDCSPTATISSIATTLDSGHTVSIAVGNATTNPVIECTLYRVSSGGTPSTTGVIAGPSATLCSATVVDNGLAGDTTSPPATNLTGHTTLGDGYLVFPNGVAWNVPQMTDGVLCASGGVISFTDHSCGGSGSPTEFQVNGGDLTSSTIVDFVNGTYLTVTNPTAGHVKFDITSLPVPGPATLGGVESITCSSQFISAISTLGVPTCSSLPAAVVLNNQSNTYSSAKTQIFGASTTAGASLNIPNGTAPTSPNTGDLWAASGVLKYFDGSNTDSLVRIQGAVTSGNCPQFSGTTGAVGDSGAPCGGSGGSALFTSFQFASNTAMTGSGVYFQLVPGVGLTSSYTGAGSVGSPFIGTLTLAVPSATTLGGIESKTCATSNWVSLISTAGVVTCSQPASTDLSDYGSVPNAALAHSAITIAGTSVSLGGSTSAFPSPGIIGGTTPAAAHFTTESLTGQLTSTLATGTAPFPVTSTTLNTNFNAALLLGGTWAIPGAIGATTPNNGNFLSVGISGVLSGTGITNLFASPPPMGTSAPAPGQFTTLGSNSTTILDGTTIPASATLSRVIFTGTKTLSVSSIAPGSCNTDTVPAPGVVSTDVVKATPNSDLSAVTGFQPTGPVLTIYPPTPSVNLITIKICSNAGNPGSITPGTVNLNLLVAR